jgi:hypothetical protein
MIKLLGLAGLPRGKARPDRLCQLSIDCANSRPVLILCQFCSRRQPKPANSNARKRLILMVGMGSCRRGSGVFSFIAPRSVVRFHPSLPVTFQLITTYSKSKGSQKPEKRPRINTHQQLGRSEHRVSGRATVCELPGWTRLKAPKAVGEAATLERVLPSPEENSRRIDEAGAESYRRPVLVVACDGAHAPTRPPGGRRTKRGPGTWREVKGSRLYLLGQEDRVIHVARWHQIAEEERRRLSGSWRHGFRATECVSVTNDSEIGLPVEPD